MPTVPGLQEKQNAALLVLSHEPIQSLWRPETGAAGTCVALQEYLQEAIWQSGDRGLTRLLPKSVPSIYVAD